jgi:hypothetical protein
MLSAAVLASCSNSGNQDQQDAGGPPPNNCATQSAALTNSQCQLTLGQTVTDYIRAPNDQVWYSIQMPSTVDPRTLVQVTAGYAAPSSPVNLASIFSTPATARAWAALSTIMDRGRRSRSTLSSDTRWPTESFWSS